MARASEEDAAALARLEADALVQRSGGRLRTTRRWQGAMARAALQLVRADDPSADLRVPIAYALVELYGADCADDELARMVEAMLPIEAAELDPRLASGSLSTPA